MSSAFSAYNDGSVLKAMHGRWLEPDRILNIETEGRAGGNSIARDEMELVSIFGNDHNSGLPYSGHSSDKRQCDEWKKTLLHWRHEGDLSSLASEMVSPR